MSVTLAGERLGLVLTALERAAGDEDDPGLAARFAGLAEELQGLADRPNPAAHIRRQAINAAGARLRAGTRKAEVDALARMYAYTDSLRALVRAGLAEPGVEPPMGTYEDPRHVEELIRFAGGEYAAAELGLAP